MVPRRASLDRIAERYGLRDVYVFGSRVSEIAAAVGRGHAVAASGSDTDIAVQPLRRRPLDARDRVRLTLELEDLFDAPRVDLVVLSDLEVVADAIPVWIRRMQRVDGKA